MLWVISWNSSCFFPPLLCICCLLVSPLVSMVCVHFCGYACLCCGLGPQGMTLCLLGCCSGHLILRHHSFLELLAFFLLCIQGFFCHCSNIAGLSIINSIKKTNSEGYLFLVEHKFQIIPYYSKKLSDGNISNMVQNAMVCNTRLLP